MSTTRAYAADDEQMANRDRAEGQHRVSGCGVDFRQRPQRVCEPHESPRDVRLMCGIDPDGESMRSAWDQWMADQDAFFTRDRTRERVDLIVDGSPTLPNDPETEFVVIGAS